MSDILNLCNLVSKVDTTILLEGESGVGKSKIAYYIHQKSFRNKNPFIKVDCSSIPESLIESELFGYSEGSFTGAIKGGKKGLISEADGGTLFLDEIADVPLSIQVKLLTLIQEKKIMPIGTNEWIKVNIRIISATNKNLKKLVHEGKFREDLYYRLKVVPIIIPSLRERKLDIVPLIDIILKRLNSYYNFNKSISPSAIKKLLEYNYPGNVRELENIIERLVVTTQKERITLLDVNYILSQEPAEYTDLFSTSNDSFQEKVNNYEKSLILNLYDKYNSIKEMSLFGKINESTLRKKIKKYNLDI